MSIQSIGTSSQVVQTIGDRAPSTTVIASGGATTSVGSVATPSSTAAIQAPTPTQLSKAIQDLNKSIQPTSPSLEFSVDATSNQMVVKVVDQETNQVLMQIPSQEVIDMSQSLDKLQGLLVKLKA